jgi:hypothetical protein
MRSCASQRPVAFRLRLGLTFLGLGLLLPGVIQAQRPIPPPHFAIQNARIVTVSGQTIDRGTIVIEDGLITAVGRSAQAPAEGPVRRDRNRRPTHWDLRIVRRHSPG